MSKYVSFTIPLKDQKIKYEDGGTNLPYQFRVTVWATCSKRQYELGAGPDSVKKRCTCMSRLPQTSQASGIAGWQGVICSPLKVSSTSSAQIAQKCGLHPLGCFALGSAETGTLIHAPDVAPWHFRAVYGKTMMTKGQSNFWNFLSFENITKKESLHLSEDKPIFTD